MTKEKFLRNFALALTFVVIAGAAGQLRRMDNKPPRRHRHHPAAESASVHGHTNPTSPLDGGMFARAYLNNPSVLVRFRAGVTPQQVEALTNGLNDRVEDRYETVDGLTAITDLDGAGAARVAAEYESFGDIVEYVEADSVIMSEPLEVKRAVRIAATEAQPNDPMFAEQWGLSNTGQREGRAGGDIAALEAWKRTKGDANQVVAVLDSGVNYTHPDLAENIWMRPAALAPYIDAELGEINDLHGYNAEANSGDPMDENGHGTHCAGIVGAVGDNGVGVAGVNWQVKIMPLKFMGRNGFGTTKNAIEAINYVIARRKAGVPVSIISASWGSTLYSRALEDAIRAAGDAGITFIAASGNAKTNTDKSKHYPASYNLPNVLSVAALNRQDELASFSNYGAKSVHIAAPGAEIVSTWLGTDYFEASGTSMATPVVAGVAALVLAVEPDFKVAELRARLIESTDKLDSLSGRVVSGGRLNAARAVEAK